MPVQSDAAPRPEPLAASLHVPVLPTVVLAQAQPQAGERCLDCTLGMGGHSAALLATGATVWGIDRDPAAQHLASERLAEAGARFRCLPGTFATVAAELAEAGERFDVLLADLGVSSLQLDDDERGFGLRSQQALDLRMGGVGECAHELIARLDDTTLANLLFRYGEERRSRRIAPALRAAVAAGRCSGTELAAAIRAVVPGHHKRHPAQRSFQALRIAINDELGELERLLALVPALLRPGGRAVVISFHSLEDRLVKQAFRHGLQAGSYVAVAKKVLTADEAECRDNPRSKAAKLRWARRREDS